MLEFKNLVLSQTWKFMLFNNSEILSKKLKMRRLETQKGLTKCSERLS